MLRCSCGGSVEVPTIRGMRELEVVADEQPAVGRWSPRQGAIFVGSVLAIGSLILGGYIWLMRPSENSASILDSEVDEAAIEREVSGLTVVDTFTRIQLFNLPPFLAGHMKQGSVPIQLLPSANLIAAFEGQGQWLAPEAIKERSKQVAKHALEQRARAHTRQGMNDWLWLVAGIGAIGILLVSSALLSGRSRARPRQPMQSRSGTAASDVAQRL